MSIQRRASLADAFGACALERRVRSITAGRSSALLPRLIGRDDSSPTSRRLDLMGTFSGSWSEPPADSAAEASASFEGWGRVEGGGPFGISGQLAAVDVQLSGHAVRGTVTLSNARGTLTLAVRKAQPGFATGPGQAAYSYVVHKATGKHGGRSDSGVLEITTLPTNGDTRPSAFQISIRSNQVPESLDADFALSGSVTGAIVEYDLPNQDGSSDRVVLAGAGRLGSHGRVTLTGSVTLPADTSAPALGRLVLVNSRGTVSLSLAERDDHDPPDATTTRWFDFRVNDATGSYRGVSASGILHLDVISLVGRDGSSSSDARFRLSFLTPQAD